MGDILSKQYKIAICDNEVIWVEKIKETIEKYFLSSRNNVQISTFENAEILLHTDLEFDYLFLDIEMPNISGIKVKNQLRKENKKIGIIFISNHDHYKDDAFGKNVISYICKDNLGKIQKVLGQIEREDSYFNNIDISGRKIYTNTIIYLKGDGSYTDIFLDTGEIIKYAMTIHKSLEKLNSKIFVRVHKSYAVNLMYVIDYNYNRVVLRNEITVQLSRVYHDGFQNAYHSYLLEG